MKTIVIRCFDNKMQFFSWLKNKNKIILFDGAMGTQIIQQGLEWGKLQDILNIENLSVIQNILSNYYKAGSDMVQTCTFGSNLLSLKSHNLTEQLELINSKALENCLYARPRQKLVVGDIGPSGSYRPPVGTVDEKEWINGFKSQVEILESGVDVWHVETMVDIKEMQSAITAIKDVSKKPIMASMTYRNTKRRGFYTLMGDSLEECIDILEDEQVAVIGTNCTLGAHEMIQLAKDMKELTTRPLLMKPNAGQPRLEGGSVVYDQEPDKFVSDINEMIEAGVKIIGGCCGTTPEHIHKLRKLIDSNR